MLCIVCMCANDYSALGCLLIQGRIEKLGWGPDFMSNTENEASTPSPSILDIKHYSSLFFFVFQPLPVYSPFSYSF